MVRIFISHAHSDNVIAKELVDLLYAAIPSLRTEDIRCTSDPDYQVLFGKPISEQLKKDLNNTTGVIALITQDSLRSAWVLMELGLCLATEKLVVPIIGPGLGYGDLPGLLSDYPAVLMDDANPSSRMNNAIDQLAKELGSRAESNSRSNAQLNSFISEFKAQEKDFDGFTEDLGNGVKLEMVAIPDGTFMMGSPKRKGKNSEKPQHEVTVQSFYMSKYPITQAQYQQIMGKNPSNFKGDDLPVESVSWDDAVEFTHRLWRRETGKKYRFWRRETRKKYSLPTEAQWEYACRAETTTPYSFDITISKTLVNFDNNFKKTTPVGQYPANDFGLCDMHGNVREWCQDDWHGDYKNAPNDGSVWLSEENSKKVVRGGSWFHDLDICRSAFRYSLSHVSRFATVGFRVVCIAPLTT